MGNVPLCVNKESDAISAFVMQPPTKITDVIINIFGNITYVDSLIVGELCNFVPLLRRASHCTHH